MGTRGSSPSHIPGVKHVSDATRQAAPGLDPHGLAASKAHFTFLHELSNATRSLSDPAEIMRATACLLGQHLRASRCAYAEVEDDNDQFTILHDYTDNCETTVGTYSLNSFGARAAAAMRQGTMLVIRDVDRELVDSDGAATFNAIGIKAIVCCPLVKESGLRAMMAVHQCSPRGWSQYDILLVQEVVERCWDSIERARAEAGLARSVRQFHDLFEAAPDAILMTDAAGEIVLVNRQTEKMFLVSRKALLGQPIRHVLPGLEGAGESGDQLEDYRGLFGRRSDGSEFPVEIRRGQMDHERAARIVTVVRDVTERELAQTYLLRAQRLGSIGTLAGGIAHDLNNALAPILMATELLRTGRHDSASLTELAQTIEDNARRAGAMVRQLQTFAHGARGEREDIHPGELLEETVTALEDGLSESFDIRVAVEDGTREFSGDLLALKQVLLDLCNNAVEAMEEGGTLTLGARNIDVDEAYAATIPETTVGPHTLIEVSDDGCGIPADQLLRVFEPFFSTKPPDRAAGLGLSSAFGVVKSHGGFMDITSEVARGTVVSLYFKSIAQTSRGAAESAGASKSLVRGNGATILLVDDEEAMLDVGKRVLESLGFNVITAADGTDALIKAAESKEKLRVVLSDLHMPHMDGFSLTRALIRMIPSVSVVIMSGRLEEQDEEKLERLGVSALLNKPFTRARLSEVLQGVIEAQA